MKKLLFILLLVVCTSGATIKNTTSDFCDGFEKGYKAGWCYQIVGCIDPIIPVCPVPNVNENSEQDGYNKGFVQGRADRED